MKNIIQPEGLVKWFLTIQKLYNITYLNIDIEGEPNERVIISIKAFIENPKKKKVKLK